MTSAIRLIRAIERADNRGRHAEANYYRSRMRKLLIKGT